MLPHVSFTSGTANKDELTGLLQRTADRLNMLGRYSCTVSGNTLSIMPLFAAVPFLTVSPVAVRDNSDDFVRYLDSNPSDYLVNMYAQNDGSIGNPDQQSLDNLTNDFANAAMPITQKLAYVRAALSQTHPRHLRRILSDVVLPWFFKEYPEGRIVAIAQTEEAHRYEAAIRTLHTLSLYGFEQAKIDAGRRKPFSDLVSNAFFRFNNVLKIVTQYNGPYLDAVVIDGIMTSFVFIFPRSVHRRSFDDFGMSAIIAPLSSLSSSPETFMEDGLPDFVPKIHDPRTATETEVWVRYWMDAFNSTFDRLYNLTLSCDSSGQISFEPMMRHILQYERVLMEVAWTCTMTDQFLRKILTYGILDKITSFMADSWCSGTKKTFGTQKFIKSLSHGFLVGRLPQLFDNSVLQTNAGNWLQETYNNLIDANRKSSFPSSLISSGHVAFGSAYPVDLTPAAALPGSGSTVTEEQHLAQVIRAIRNTHHGFSELNSGAFAVLSTTSGAVTEHLVNVAPLLAFAMLDSPDATIRQQW